MSFSFGMFGRTELGEAICARKKQKIIDLLKAERDPNETAQDDLVGYTPLMLELMQENPDNEILKALIDAGADPLIEDKLKRTALDDYAEIEEQKDILRTGLIPKIRHTYEPPKEFSLRNWFKITPEQAADIETFKKEYERQFSLLTPEQQRLVKRKELKSQLFFFLFPFFYIAFLVLCILWAIERHK